MTLIAHFAPPISKYSYKGAFNNYVDKMRGGRGSKMSVFVHAEGIKMSTQGRGGQKMAKFSLSSCWMAPYCEMRVKIRHALL